MKRVLTGFIITLVFIAGFWPIAVTEEMIAALIEHSIQGGLTIQATDVKKGMFYDFRAGHIILRKSGDILLSLDSLKAVIKPLSLLTLRLPLYFEGETGGGRINGSVELLGSDHRLSVNVEDANAQGLPFFSLIGLKGSARISGALAFEKGRGDIKFSAIDADLGKSDFGGITVPLDVFRTAKGAMAVSGDTMRITSFVMEGDGIYARIKGDIKGKNLDLVMELMPEKTFKEKNLIFSLLENYKISPGYYSVPIRKTITYQPAVMN